ncbi:cupin domain-containing protein [Calothrix sp. NIES-4071]|nr:cupin domain-containing protein [Calothrix sp. NIES-4071]BAZ59578.1 cupin domain-containing protein [Calothrix sp. NIES-4105]
MTEKNPFLLRAKEIADSMQTFSHPWNSNSEISWTRMGRLVGLKRTGANFTVVPPGKESFTYHSHHREEEWIYILSGSGTAEIDGEEFEVSAGDFMGFPTPSVPHHLRNTGTENLVYLTGGENLDVEIGEFPRQEKLLIRRGDNVQVFNTKDAKPFGTIDTE